MLFRVKWAWFGLGVAAVLALLFAGLSVAGEMRYRNCISRVEARYPVAYQQPLQGAEDQWRAEPEYQPGEFVYSSEADRLAALGRCEPWL